MNLTEMAGVLTIAGQVDARIRATADVVKVWHAFVGEVSATDAAEAVSYHYATSTDALMPAHLLRWSKRVRAERVAALGPVEDWMGDVDPDDPAWHDIRVRRVEAAAAGRPLDAPHALGGPTTPPEPR